MGELKFSIYIPTHNRLELIKRSIDSVVNQSYENIEIIVCDDGSTDGTFEYLHSLEIKNLLVLRNSEPKGACFSRNLCIKNATGDFVTGLDDDDYFEENRIEIFNGMITDLEQKKENYSFIFGGIKVISTSGEIRVPIFPVVNSSDILKKNIVGNQICCKRSILLEQGGFDEKLPAMQDYDLWIRLINSHGQALGVNSYSYIHDISHPHERISKNGNKVISAFRIICDKNKGDIYFNESIFSLNLYAYGFKEYKLSLKKCFTYIGKGCFFRALRIWYNKK